MLYTFPDYYREFHCTADRCEDTCCAGWQIAVDEKTMKQYWRQKGALGRMLRRGIRRKERVFRRKEDGRCAFLDEQNLCRIYRGLGQQGLCRTCRVYPRHIEEFENVREVSLSVSCPEVARILLGRKEPVNFLSYEKPGEEMWPEFDELTYSVQVDGREAMLDILKDRGKEIWLRAGLALGLAHDMERKIRRGETFSCQDVIRRYQKEAAEQYTRERMAEFHRTPEAVFWAAREEFRSLYDLELLREDWEALLRESEFFLYQDSRQYGKIEAEFQEWLGKGFPEWEIACEQLLVYFTATYFCGAIYDGRVWGKARMAAVSVFLIYELWKARWLKNERQLDLEDRVEIVYRYSRELEHSDENLERLERQMERRGIPWRRKDEGK